MTETTHKIHLKLPGDTSFADLRLTRESDGNITFDWRAVDAICQANGLDVEPFRHGHVDNVLALIIAWYQQHRAVGGDPDPAAEDLIARAKTDDTYGGSHKPGST